MRKQSNKEVALHRAFHFWDEATTFSRYMMVMFFGLAIYESSIAMFYVFITAFFVNGFCYYSMTTTLDNIVREKQRHNYLQE